MTSHTSNVNFKNLIQDLADMYPFPIPEAVLTELIANALDAKSKIIKINFDPKRSILIVEDYGSGMVKTQFDEYHDFAARLKTRGSGIGFAGLGAKISFNASTRVITETWSKKFKGGSDWYLESPKKLVWEDIKELKYLDHIGTRVEVFFNPNSEIRHYNEQEFKLSIIRHFLPLFDNEFSKIYDALDMYKDINFYINDRLIDKFNLEKEFNFEKIKRFVIKSGKKRFGFGAFGLSSKEYPLDENSAGIGLSVYGKIVKFDFMNQYLGEISPKIFGIAEIPPLVKFLNTSKTGFIRHRTTAKEFSRYYESIRYEFKEWLKEIGIKSVGTIGTEDAIKLEQELKKLVNELPELNQLFGLAAKRPSLVSNPKGEIDAEITEGAEITFPDGEGEDKGGEGILDPGASEGTALISSKNGGEKSTPISRKKRRGIRISFIDLPDRNELGWVEGNVVIINSAHPSYLKVNKNNLARKLHNIFSIAVSLDKELKEQEIIEISDSYINRLMSAWGKIK